MAKSCLRYNHGQRPGRAALQRLIDAAGSTVFKPLSRPFPEVRRLLVILTGPPAEAFLATSILPHLRTAYPKSNIQVMAGADAGLFLVSNPYIDGVISLPQAGVDGLASLPGGVLGLMPSFFKVMGVVRKASYDLVIDLGTNPGYTIPASYIGRPRYMAGFSTAGYAFLLDKVVGCMPDSCVTGRVAAMLGALGLYDSHRALRPELTISKEAHDEAADALISIGLPEKAPFVLMHTGAPERCCSWRKERWQEAVDKIVREYGLKVVMFDNAYGDIKGCIKLGGLVSFEVLAAISRMAELFIGTHALHAQVASVLGTPAVLLWCGTRNEAGMRQPGSSLTIVRKNLPCSPCFRKKGCQDMSCMSITSEECMNEARWYLDSLKASRVIRFRR